MNAAVLMQNASSVAPHRRTKVKNIGGGGEGLEYGGGGGQGRTKISQQAHDVVTTLMQRNDVAVISTSCDY